MILTNLPISAVMAARVARVPPDGAPPLLVMKHRNVFNSASVTFLSSSAVKNAAKSGRPPAPAEFGQIMTFLFLAQSCSGISLCVKGTSPLTST